MNDDLVIYAPFVLAFGGTCAAALIGMVGGFVVPASAAAVGGVAVVAGTCACAGFEGATLTTLGLFGGVSLLSEADSPCSAAFTFGVTSCLFAVGTLFCAAPVLGALQVGLPILPILTCFSAGLGVIALAAFTAVGIGAGINYFANQEDEKVNHSMCLN